MFSPEKCIYTTLHTECSLTLEIILFTLKEVKCLCVHRRRGRGSIDLSSWVMEINLLFSSWRMALQLVVRDCLTLCVIDGARSNSVMKHKVAVPWMPCSAGNDDFIPVVKWCQSATFTGEAVADGAVCKLSRCCHLNTFVIIEYPGMHPQGSLIQSPGPAQDMPRIPPCAWVCSPDASGALAGLAQLGVLCCVVSRLVFNLILFHLGEQQTEAGLF